MAIVTITKDNFQSEVLEAKGAVLLDFWAAWCGPCRMLSPLIDQIAAEMPELKVGKINTDEQEELAERFQIMTIPTLMVFKDGQPVNKSIGVIPKAAIAKLVE
ncbi:MAG: thioredoxin [Bacillota bacterium]|nr:thioredoxin [Bacillota bacterium]